MNNEERIKARIERDKLRRAAKKQERSKQYDNFDNLITMKNYVHSLNKCCKGVMWKAKPQKYRQTSMTNIHNTIMQIRNGKLPKLKNTQSIVLYERGKRRTIVPIAFDDRVTQRNICDNALMPIIANTLIYDNGASTKGKGIHFARQRLEQFLYKTVAQYGEDFYIWTFDFKSFFDSIPHSTCYNVLIDYFQDKRIVNIIMDIIRSYQKPKLELIEDEQERKEKLKALQDNKSHGICLGSQISQIMALLVPNKLDHLIKDKKGVKYYIRYMDDGVVFHKSKSYLKELQEQAKAICNVLGLQFNEKKTRIIKASKGFMFLKIRYRVKGHKVIKTLAKSGVKRMRRKLKKFVKLVDNGKMTYDDVYNSLRAYLSHAKLCMSYHTVRSIIKLYNQLFDGYRITKKYQRLKEGGRLNHALLQSDKRSEFYWNWYNLRAA